MPSSDLPRMEQAQSSLYQSIILHLGSSQQLTNTFVMTSLSRIPAARLYPMNHFGFYFFHTETKPISLQLMPYQMFNLKRAKSCIWGRLRCTRLENTHYSCG